MSAIPKVRAKKDQQINVRFSTAEFDDLNEIAEIEDRDRSYLIGFFTRWGMRQYFRCKSLTVMRYTDIPLPLQEDVLKQAKVRLQLRKDAANGEVHEEESEARPTRQKAR